MKKILIAILTSILVLAGCSPSPKRISSSYISPVQYNSYSCEQLEQELARINARAAEVAGVQREAATQDAVALGAGLFLFWPALFFMLGGDKAEEFSRLKGQIEAVEQSAIEKGCVGVYTRIGDQRKSAENRSK